MNIRKYHLILLFLYAIPLFSFRLGSYDLWPPDEPRYALIAREMLQSGDYWVPHVNNIPYKEKPPLFFWSIALCSTLTGKGEVTPITTRLPSLIAALVVLLFTGLLARALYTPPVAFWSMLILMTMQRFWWNARFGQIDMLLTACLTAAIYAYWRWTQGRRWGWLLFFYTAVLAGVFAKGPGVLVFPGLLVVVQSWRSTYRKEAWLHLAAGFFLIALVYAVWMIPVHRALAGAIQSTVSDTLASNLFRQTLGRFLLGVSHAQWPWYYLINLPIDWLPWTLFLPITCIFAFKAFRAHDPGPRFLLSWIVPVFIFFTIAIGKRSVYLLPLYPACAILFAAAMLQFMDTPWGKTQHRMGVVLAVLPLLLSIAPFALFATPYRAFWNYGWALFSLILAIYGLFLLYRLYAAKRLYLPAHVVGIFSILAFFAASLFFPSLNNHKSARFFCAPVAALVDQGIDFDLYTIGFAREEYIFYSKHPFKELFTKEVPLSQDHGLTPLQMARFQKECSRVINKAQTKIEVQDINAISETELEALHEALQEAIHKKNYAEPLWLDFKAGLEEQVRAFFEDFATPRPAFLYIQAADWYWIYGLHPETGGAMVMDQSAVGSRSMLLIANEAGAALLSTIP